MNTAHHKVRNALARTAHGLDGILVVEDTDLIETVFNDAVDIICEELASAHCVRAPDQAIITMGTTTLRILPASRVA